MRIHYYFHTSECDAVRHSVPSCGLKLGTVIRLIENRLQIFPAGYQRQVWPQAFRLMLAKSSVNFLCSLSAAIHSSRDQRETTTRAMRLRVVQRGKPCYSRTQLNGSVLLGSEQRKEHPFWMRSVSLIDNGCLPDGRGWKTVCSFVCLYGCTPVDSQWWLNAATLVVCMSVNGSTMSFRPWLMVSFECFMLSLGVWEFRLCPRVYMDGIAVS